ncbi:hypothetical protein PF005_g30896 [Phytophthora fragariae]|uniref:Cystatin domain-containing protein n=1 Tax=Phytophthora fragariae TaxID=53985 RepID=A0A6A3PNV2_9STRA|nr:hypothetical protein PF003_g13991 [Phytophthora fragariae]KAE8918629.1 hypothetical protein PF009_g31058 [Phytophthora fragariae]KAE8960442.1 hypothetical protein PF011_g30093 [Phytophthora fragariae]KAE9059646.1 hypothetical protein PF010_g30535 [Phytophthora fragariae]KAE9060541.1 hypothetical protein PF007_g30571 [Phytophthora fragariae]
MPSLRAIASSIFALALVSAPSAQAGAWVKANVTAADNALLLTAVGDVNAYSSGASTYLCVYKVKSLKKQNGAVAGATKYNFAVTGCNAGEEFAGRCPDLTSFPGCGGYNVVVSSASKTSKPKVTSVKKQASK